MKILKKYWILIIAVVVLGGILYLNRFSTISKVEKGKILYIENCANCHGEKGEGLKKLIPPLAGNDYVPANFSEIPCIIRYGIKGEIVVNNQSYNQPMPGLSNLEADEIKAIMDFMIHEWYADLESPSQGDVSEKVNNCEE